MLQLVLGPVDEALGRVERRTRVPSPLRVELHERGIGDPLAHLGIEAEDERGPRLRGTGRPDLRCRSHFENAPEAESLVADALVRVLGALSEPAEPLEVPALERAAAVRDQKHRRGFGLQHERDLPAIAARCRGQRVVRVLQQLEYAPSSIGLRDLATEACDRLVLPAPVLELIQERADLAQRMADDFPVRALPRRRCIYVHALLALHFSAVQPAPKPYWHRTIAERTPIVMSHLSLLFR